MGTSSSSLLGRSNRLASVETKEAAGRPADPVKARDCEGVGPEREEVLVPGDELRTARVAVCNGAVEGEEHAASACRHARPRGAGAPVIAVAHGCACGATVHSVHAWLEPEKVDDLIARHVE
eukprot:CAMPEP_0185189000 /NCGR_PEP_ID=MMETSP1140-20130426/5761_1 /TAXON_ID=298111 /ORGANISM="Pavlova sp., Strain CCMP459" /LENGTH=121 /DNA_ID=CAMNT_0027755529 /DNA_START=80 /DNA_END=445 /DNA_ORIENTATION=-